MNLKKTQRTAFQIYTAQKVTTNKLTQNVPKITNQKKRHRDADPHKHTILHFAKEVCQRLQITNTIKAGYKKFLTSITKVLPKHSQNVNNTKNSKKMFRNS